MRFLFFYIEKASTTGNREYLTDILLYHYSHNLSRQYQINQIMTFSQGPDGHSITAIHAEGHDWTAMDTVREPGPARQRRPIVYTMCSGGLAFTDFFCGMKIRYPIPIFMNRNRNTISDTSTRATSALLYSRRL